MTIDGIEQTIAYSSRLFSKVERNYRTTERELLAVMESIKHFRCYLDGMKFTVVTDHIALMRLLTLKNNYRDVLLVGRRLFLNLLLIFIIEKGYNYNIVPDALSRIHFFYNRNVFFRIHINQILTMTIQKIPRSVSN